MNHKDPFFSVIIPTRNRSSLVGKAIKSVLNQSFDNWELLVIDDGSTDDTSDVVGAFNDDRIHYHLKEHAERSSARNLGIELSSAPYVCFLDDDDYYLEDYLFDFYNCYQTENPDTILRTGFSMLHKGKMVKRTNYKEESHGHPVNWAVEHMCGVWTLSIPKKYLLSDQFNNRFPHWQDTHLILRLLEKYPFKQLDSRSYIYVIHDKMGSKIYNRPDALDRIQLNIDAIRDLFVSYPSIAQRFDYNIEKNQVAGKWAQHFVNALYYRKIKLASNIFTSGFNDQNIRFLKSIMSEGVRMIGNKIRLN